MKVFRQFDWSLRSCGLHGHVTYAPSEPELADRLRASTIAGDAWRCLRCDSWVAGPPHGTGPAGDAPIILRGRALQDAVVLRALGTERFIRGLLLVALGYGIVRFNGARDALRRVFDEYLPLVRPITDKIGINVEQTTPVKYIEKALTLEHHTLLLVSIGVFAYAALNLAEGTGLWLLKRWGEYVAVVGTSAFLPLEVYELAEGFTWLKAVVFVINGAAVAYLLWSKRLFGIRGGHVAFEAARRSVSLIEVENAALMAPGPSPAAAPGNLTIREGR